MPVYSILFGPRQSGTDQVEWCRENCKGFWNFFEYKEHHIVERGSNPPGSPFYGLKYLKTCWLCEFHFQLKEDVDEFIIFWKLSGMNFFEHHPTFAGWVVQK